MYGMVESGRLACSAVNNSVSIAVAVQPTTALKLKAEKTKAAKRHPSEGLHSSEM